MEIIYYPNKEKVENSMNEDSPLLMLISYDGKQVIISNIDDSFEHIILLRSVGFPDINIDKYFRIVANKDGADWTFVCPENYKLILDKQKRIKQFFDDGITIMSKVLEEFNIKPEINIPTRYRRHFNMLKDND